jgi:hypothetical protein
MLPEPPRPPAWAALLEGVEQALAAALEAAAQREQALGDPSKPEFPAGAGALEGLAPFGQRVQGLGECAARADSAIAEVDAALAAGEDALRAWFHAAEAVRRKLAAWASGA